MGGSIAFYDKSGERLHTIYCSATPVYGKEKFKERLSREIERVKETFPDVLYIERDEEIRKVLTYYKNHKSKMAYARHVKDKLPIGSGVTEAACKTVVKQRMCISGSRWKDDGASCVLALRTLKLTAGRWQQFWGYAMRHGCTLC